MKNRILIVGLVLALAAAIVGGLLLIGFEESSGQIQQLELYTDPFAAAREGSPEGPRKLRFPAFDNPRLLWIISARAELVTREGSLPSPQPAYRAQVGFEYVRHARLHRLPVYHTDRLFTLSQRQPAVVFPVGFGLPFYTDEPLTVTTRLFDRSPAGALDGVRLRVVLEYVFDRDLDLPMKPLYVTSGVQDDSHDGDPVPILRVSFDTRVHYITAPLQPHAEAVELHDLSAGETVYNSAEPSTVEPRDARQAEYFSSAEGIKLYADREYRLIGNPPAPATDTGHDSAIALVYLRDKQYKKRPRQRAPVAHFEKPLDMADERLVMHTNHGELQIAFYEDVAPRHTEQILRLARLGVYDGTKFFRVEPGFLIQLGFPEQRLGPPLTAEQRAALKPIEAELSDLPQNKWTVSMALRDNANPDSAVASFFILLEDVRRLDQQFTIVGSVISGLGTLNSITKVPLDGSSPLQPVFIERAEVKTGRQLQEERMGRGGGRAPS